MIIMLAGFFGVVLLLAVITVFRIKAAIAMGKSFAKPPTSVSTYTVQAQTWQPVLNAIGSLAAVNGVTVSTDQSGIVAEIPFESGTAVKAGDILMALDTRQDEAMLHSAEAQRDLAKLTTDRQVDLLKRKVAAQADSDSAQAQYQQALASVEQVQAVMAHKIVKAPFDGVLGLRQVNKGQYFSAGTPIVTLQSLDPIYVNFSLPQRSIQAVGKGRKVQIVVDGLADKNFEGEINAVESLVDVSTRNLQVQATLHNPDGKLRPGMYASVAVQLPEQTKVLAVPSSAVNYAPYGDSVFVVTKLKSDEDGSEYEGVIEQFVTVGQARGDQVAIVSGLKVGDVIVSGGTFRLKARAPVQINNSVQPDNNLHPSPPDT